jgi:hypothetical protein
VSKKNDLKDMTLAGSIGCGILTLYAALIAIPIGIMTTAVCVVLWAFGVI